MRLADGLRLLFLCFSLPSLVSVTHTTLWEDRERMGRKALVSNKPSEHQVLHKLVFFIHPCTKCAQSMSTFIVCWDRIVALCSRFVFVAGGRSSFVVLFVQLELLTRN